jgi:hypothetical protein
MSGYLDFRKLGASIQEIYRSLDSNKYEWKDFEDFSENEVFICLLVKAVPFIKSFQVKLTMICENTVSNWWFVKKSFANRI